MFFWLDHNVFILPSLCVTDRRSVIDTFWTVAVARSVTSIALNYGRVFRLMLSLGAVVELGLVIVLVVIRSVYENALNSIWSAPVEMDLLPLRLLLADWLEQQLKNRINKILICNKIKSTISFGYLNLEKISRKK